MADTPISSLPAATTVDGTESVPVVQGGTTKKLASGVVLNRANHTGMQSADSLVDGTTNKAYTATEKTKLAGVATGATAYTDTMAQAANASALGTKVNSSTYTAGLAGKADLVGGTVPDAQLPTRLSDTSLKAAFVSVLVYSGSAYPARPSGVPGGLVRYIGPSQPSDWLSGDEWINNS